MCGDNSHQLFPAVILLLVHNENRNSLIRICLTGVHEEKMQTLPVTQLDCDYVANLKKKNLSRCPFKKVREGKRAEEGCHLPLCLRDDLY